MSASAAEQPAPAKVKTSTLLWRYLAYAKPYRGLVALVICAGIAKFTLPLIPARVTRHIVNDVILNTGGLERAQRLDELLRLGAVILAVALLETVVIYIRGSRTVMVGSSVTFDVREALWRHLQRLSLGFHQSRPSGALLSRLMTDIGQAQQLINNGVINICIDAVSGTAALIVLCTISWKLTLLIVAVLPFYGFLYRSINPKIRQASHDVQEQTSVISGTAIERLNAIAVVQSFAQERNEALYFSEQADELRERTVRHGRLNVTLQSISELLVTLGSTAVWLVGGWMAVAGKITAGEIVEFTAVAALLYMPIRRFSEANIILQSSLAAIQRVFNVFDIVPAVRDKPGLPDRSPTHGALAFERVTFGYPKGLPVLHDVTFEIAAGERIAVVGESGAGKSTLATLIPRLFDVTAGRVLIDGIDVRDYPHRRLRRSIGIVLQESILFTGTIRENLRYARKKASEDEIIAAAKVANAHEFIMQFPQGYDTIVGERGKTLSGGQRQRISLARTILQDPRILLLDEATSSLDSESENLITEAMERVMQGRTCLIIAHRLSTVVGADRILVMRQGRLVEHGTHTALLAAGGYYRFLFDQQFGQMNEMLQSHAAAPLFTHN